MNRQTPNDSPLKIRAESKLATSTVELAALQTQSLWAHLNAVALTVAIGATIPCAMILSGIVSLPESFAINEVVARMVALSGLLIAIAHGASRFRRTSVSFRALPAITAIWMLAAYCAWIAGGLIAVADTPQLLDLPRRIKQASTFVDLRDIAALTDLHIMAGLSVLFLAVLLSSLPVPLVALVPVSACILIGNLAVLYYLNMRWSWYLATAVIQCCSLILPVTLELQVKKRAKQELELTRKRQMEAIRKHEHELDLAKTIQSSFLPPESWQARPYLNIRAMQRSHLKVGGDWMATRETADGRVIALVLDVTGKGMQAALVAHAVQSIWAMMLNDALFDPKRFLNKINEALFALGSGKTHTATAGIVEINQERLVYWSAGHCPLRIFFDEPGRESFTMLYSYGSVLGFESKLDIEPGVFGLGDVRNFSAILGSDGIFDGIPRGKKGHLEFYHSLRTEGWPAIDRLPVEDDKTLLWLAWNDGKKIQET